jgi:hypothetical protein
MSAPMAPTYPTDTSTSNFAGFDIVPRLTTSAFDRGRWRSFIEAVKRHYRLADEKDLLTMTTQTIEFQIGDKQHLVLPIQGHKFLRFCSRLCPDESGLGVGLDFEKIGEIRKTVAKIAVKHFHGRIICWNGSVGTKGNYSWEEVYETWRSYACHDSG